MVIPPRISFRVPYPENLAPRPPVSDHRGMIRFHVLGFEGTYDYGTDTWAVPASPRLAVELKVTANRAGYPYEFPGDPELAKVRQVVVYEFGGVITDAGQRPKPERYDPVGGLRAGVTMAKKKPRLIQSRATLLLIGFLMYPVTLMVMLVGLPLLLSGWVPEGGRRCSRGACEWLPP